MAFKLHTICAHLIFFLHFLKSINHPHLKKKLLGPSNKSPTHQMTVNLNTYHDTTHVFNIVYHPLTNPPIFHLSRYFGHTLPASAVNEGDFHRSISSEKRSGTYLLPPPVLSASQKRQSNKFLVPLAPPSIPPSPSPSPSHHF